MRSSETRAKVRVELDGCWEDEDEDMAGLESCGGDETARRCRVKRGSIHSG